MTQNLMSQISGPGLGMDGQANRICGSLLEARPRIITEWIL
jgi:hypothetical protein